MTDYIKESEKKIVVVIDELDRCRPDFAIKTLEIAKHIFDIENLVFIISLDMEQLGYSLKTVYGQEMDTSGYLYRFFDYVSNMPKYNEAGYIKQEFKSLNLSLFSSVSAALTKVLIEGNYSIRELQMFFSALKLMRQKFRVLHNMNKKMYIELIWIKTFYPSMLVDILKKSLFFNSSTDRIDFDKELISKYTKFKTISGSMFDVIEWDKFTQNQLLSELLDSKNQVYKWEGIKGKEITITKGVDQNSISILRIATEHPYVDEQEWMNINLLDDVRVRDHILQKIEIIDFLVNDSKNQSITKLGG